MQMMSHFVVHMFWIMKTRDADLKLLQALELMLLIAFIAGAKRCNFTVRHNILGSCFIVTKNDQCPVSKSYVSITLLELKGKFIVPDMQSFEDRNSPFQYFSLLSAAARMKLEKIQGWCFSIWILISFNAIRVTAICCSLVNFKDWFCSYKKNHFFGFCKVFAGGGSPTADSTFDKFYLPNSQLLIFHKKSTPKQFKTFIPLSTSCSDAKFRGIRVIPWFVETISKALGKRGIFPSWPCSMHIGHSSHISLHLAKSVSLPSPSEGHTSILAHYFVMPILMTLEPVIQDFQLQQ